MDTQKNHQLLSIYMHCAYFNLYDILLRIEFCDMLEKMNLYPSTRSLHLKTRLKYYRHHFKFYIYEMDDEIVADMMAYLEKLLVLSQDEVMIDLYEEMLMKMKKMMKSAA